MKKCGRCQTPKEENDFSPSQFTRSGGICRPCCTEKAREYRARHPDKVKAYEQAYRPQYYEKHKEEKAAYNRQYYLDNEADIKAQTKEYREENREWALEYAKQYYQDNKDELKAAAKEYRQEHKDERNALQREARKNDPMQKIQHNVSNLIRITIQRQGSSKNGNSILDHLGYTISELKAHLEKQFEPWMTWSNWSIYDPQTWDDSNSSTWTWQLDHIVPQASLPYTSMTDDNFKKCWELDNLRPYSAKLNSIEGANRVRHC